MRTNIEIGNRLMRLLIQTRAQVSIRRLRGKVRWDGDLSKSRLAGVRK
jgi:hypothetical protein